MLSPSPILLQLSPTKSSVSVNAVWPTQAASVDYDGEKASLNYLRVNKRSHQ
jgi:hypothetical protein